MGMFDFSPDDRWFWTMIFGGFVGYIIGKIKSWKKGGK